MIWFLRTWLLATLFILSAVLVSAQVAVQPPPAPSAVGDPVLEEPFTDDPFFDRIVDDVPAPPSAQPAQSQPVPSSVPRSSANRPPAEPRDWLTLPTRAGVRFQEIYDSVRLTGRETEDFNKLRDLRNTLVDTTEQVREQLAFAKDKVRNENLPDAQDIQFWTSELQLQLECARNPDCPFFERYDYLGYLEGDRATVVSDLENQLRGYEISQERAREADREIPAAEQLLFELESLARELDRKINDALNRDLEEQKFKTSVSLYFTGIVGVMIVLFFGLLFYDAKVRTALFSTPSAIQFVTLFSVVIAIILFGITGILQDKELSALLGGLSGYILGRYSNDTPAPSGTG